MFPFILPHVLVHAAWSPLMPFLSPDSFYVAKDLSLFPSFWLSGSYASPELIQQIFIKHSLHYFHFKQIMITLNSSWKTPLQ